MNYKRFEKDKEGYQEIVEFFYEVGLLKRMQRTGWLHLGFMEGDTVASHSFRVALISYYIARELTKEKVDINIEKVLLMSLFHDVAETRIWDLNKVSVNYVEAKEERAVNEQLSNFKEIISILKELNRGESIEAKIVKDADKLELIIQAREYEKFNDFAKEFYERNIDKLSLRISKKLANQILSTPQNWWSKLKK